MKGKKIMIRAVALALALLLCLGVVSVAAFAEGTEKVNRMRQGENLSQEKAGERDELEFWHQYSIKRKWVHRIVFQDNLKGMPKNVLDFSEKWDKTNKQVVGWYQDHVLYVAADGKISLPKDSSWLFASFTHLEELDFNNSVDTSGVENMSYMFADCVRLEKLDLSCFDTGAVKNMNSMFYRCKNLEELNVSGFKTGNVKNMCRMFAYCESLKALDAVNQGSIVNAIQSCCCNIRQEISGAQNAIQSQLAKCCYDTNLNIERGFCGVNSGIQGTNYLIQTTDAATRQLIQTLFCEQNSYLADQFCQIKTREDAREIQSLRDQLEQAKADTREANILAAINGTKCITARYNTETQTVCGSVGQRNCCCNRVQAAPTPTPTPATTDTVTDSIEDARLIDP